MQHCGTARSDVGHNVVQSRVPGEIAQGYNKRSAAWGRFSNELLLSSFLIFSIPTLLFLRPLLQKQSLQSISRNDLLDLLRKTRLAKSGAAITLLSSLMAKLHKEFHAKKALTYSAEK
ncbi:MAG: hypothetical protein JSR80_05585 [Verrucomicrobia bacterium]|nr:hypothetical protein [Verrucomicrobiota bacterium]